MSFADYTGPVATVTAIVQVPTQVLNETVQNAVPTGIAAPAVGPAKNTNKK